MQPGHFVGAKVGSGTVGGIVGAAVGNAVGCSVCVFAHFSFSKIDIFANMAISQHAQNSQRLALRPNETNKNSPPPTVGRGVGEVGECVGKDGAGEGALLGTVGALVGNVGDFVGNVGAGVGTLPILFKQYVFPSSA
jgi:hypothetical protein